MASILVIDDNESMREMLYEMLTRNGYDVIEAANGIEGVKLYREERPDLVITDILMPDKDGTETIFELKKEFPDIKIIAMSGGGAGDAEEYFESISMYVDLDDTFTKPFDMNEMLAAVKKLIG